MEIPAFLRFTPVPLKARHDGWTPVLQQRFVILLARGAGPAEAARRLGKSRQTAYALRSKPGAESFAAVWDRALRYAKHVRSTARTAPASPSPVRPEPSRPAPAAHPPAVTAERAAFSALLDRLYPQRPVDADEAAKNDEADRK